jgi:hypothetical protein
MNRYANLSGTSGIRTFELTPDSITVAFSDGAHYLYTVASAGQQNISTMHVLAQAGSGLNSFITKHVKKLYAKKW